MPVPTARERRLALRLRADELLELLEGIDPTIPEAAGARAVARDRVRRRRPTRRGRVRRRGACARLDPLTLRVLALDSGAGANLLEVAPLPSALQLLPGRHRTSAARSGTRFRHVYRIPSQPDGRRADVRVHRPRRVRGVHEGAPRAARPRRAAADARGPGAALRGRVEARRVRGARPPRRATAGGSRRFSTTSGTASWPRSARRWRGGRLRARRRRCPAARPRSFTGIDRPHRPAPVRRHRGHRLQDRQPDSQKGVHESLQLSHLRARLPRRARPRARRSG